MFSQQLVLNTVLALFAPLLNSPPTVTLDQAIFTGERSGQVSKFLGIPFAQPPTGDFRFRLPVPVSPYHGHFHATSFGRACPQQLIKLPLPPGLAEDTVEFIVNSLYRDVFPDSEDCLTINVVTPAFATPLSAFPVVVWFFGGGFELGDPSLYDGSSIVKRSIVLGEPIIYVSMNYRLNGFGFLSSQEVKDAGVGNLGLHDQREALRWIQKYIKAFGGDPSKVTIWGESAGSVSAALHMVTNGGNDEGLFRAAFMESGSPIPVSSITHGQAYYDSIVSLTGCSGASDTLACLRTVPYDALKGAISTVPGSFSYQSLILAWLPRVDGVFLTDDPQSLVRQGSVADVPFISGDCDDEGTLFSLSTLNITTDAQLKQYIHSIWLPNVSDGVLDNILALYPADITQGSPFDTGTANALTPQFKRIAAFQGDAVFQAPRRYFLQQRSGKQDIWSFLSKRFKSLPVLGSVHTSDLFNVYGGGEMADYLIRFVSKLDPNGNTGIPWPQYTTDSPNLLTFKDGLTPLKITQDTYRKDAMNYLISVMLSNPV